MVCQRDAIYRVERPDERREDEKDIYRREEVIFEAKLKIGKREIENEVQYKRQSNYCGQFFCVHLIKHGAVGNCNNGIQNHPHRPKEPRRWRPCGLDESRVPVVGARVHIISITHQSTPPRPHCGFKKTISIFCGAAADCGILQKHSRLAPYFGGDGGIRTHEGF